MVEVSLSAVIGAGVFLGLKHAFEADHLAAVMVLATERRSLWGAVGTGALWGIGHTVAVLAAGLWVLALGLRIPDRFAQLLEVLIALVLLSLGVRALRRIARGGVLHMHAHRHGPRLHLHPHLHAGEAEGDEAFHHGRPEVRPFLVGMLHGLAGSAALFVLLVATQPTPRLAWAYLGAFGLASIAGMAAMSWLVYLPVQLTVARVQRLHAGLQFGAALFSIATGLWLGFAWLGS